MGSVLKLNSIRTSVIKSHVDLCAFANFAFQLYETIQHLNIMFHDVQAEPSSLYSPRG